MHTDLGTPVASLNDLPPGDYFVQGFVNVYSEFKRADGHAVWMHDDQWEGQHWNSSPGNLYSAAAAACASTPPPRRITLVADQVDSGGHRAGGHGVGEALQDPEPAADEVLGPAHLSRRHGAAAARLRDLDDAAIPCSTARATSHWRRRSVSRKAATLHKAWMRDDFPRMLVVTLQHPTPYFDDSYAVNSVNVGPYGDAIMQELIPEVEKRFRVIGEP